MHRRRCSSLGTMSPSYRRCHAHGAYVFQTCSTPDAPLMVSKPLPPYGMDMSSVTSTTSSSFQMSFHNGSKKKFQPESWSSVLGRTYRILQAAERKQTRK